MLGSREVGNLRQPARPSAANGNFVSEDQVLNFSCIGAKVLPAGPTARAHWLGCHGPVPKSRPPPLHHAQIIGQLCKRSLFVMTFPTSTPPSLTTAKLIWERRSPARFEYRCVLPHWLGRQKAGASWFLKKGLGRILPERSIMGLRFQAGDGLALKNMYQKWEIKIIIF